MVEAELKKWGNSIGVILPAEKLKELKLGEGDKIDIAIVKKKKIDGFGLCKGAKPFKEEKEGHGRFW
ncbi:AbrB/MazE/SpoVT family DNA-binding domain-containing protein [Candidatus Woesearchaeota archaeon]|nr:AbrB/MazE/SpoVT family DNA-binding domain-containing protein [Candidatus Woesearchaeota archaeon]